jgi:hypothetical protein
MIDKSRRKELQQTFLERPPQNGVFAVRNAKTGDVWVGHSKNIDKQQNGLWARLAGGMCFNRDVQASWNAHGADAFSYDILERLTETDIHALQRMLPERADVWRAELKAGTVKGT